MNAAAIRFMDGQDCWETDSARFSFLVIDIFFGAAAIFENCVVWKWIWRAVVFYKAIYFRRKPLYVLGTEIIVESMYESTCMCVTYTLATCYMYRYFIF